MEKHIQLFLNKISYLSITISTLTLLFIFLLQPPPQTCIIPNNPNPNHKPHPKSTCDAAHRRITTIHNQNHRLWSTKAWIKSVNSFTTIFQTLTHLNNNTHALIVSAAGGQSVMSLNQIGIHDVTGVELIESPPLVTRADPHHLPFFDSVFDFGFSANFDQALFPVKYVGELERTVGVGGVIAVCVEVCGSDGVSEALKVFRRSEFVRAVNVTVMGSKMTMIVTRRIESVS